MNNHQTRTMLVAGLLTFAVMGVSSTAAQPEPEEIVLDVFETANSQVQCVLLAMGVIAHQEEPILDESRRFILDLVITSEIPSLEIECSDGEQTYREQISDREVRQTTLLSQANVQQIPLQEALTHASGPDYARLALLGCDSLDFSTAFSNACNNAIHLAEDITDVTQHPWVSDAVDAIYEYCGHDWLRVEECQAILNGELDPQPFATGINKGSCLVAINYQLFADESSTVGVPLLCSASWAGLVGGCIDPNFLMFDLPEVCGYAGIEVSAALGLLSGTMFCFHAHSKDGSSCLGAPIAGQSTTHISEYVVYGTVPGETDPLCRYAMLLNDGNYDYSCIEPTPFAELVVGEDVCPWHLQQPTTRQPISGGHSYRIALLLYIP